jgi:hypothetical protein
MFQLLLSPEQLDEDLRLPSREFVERVAMRRQVDEAQAVEAVRLRRDGASAQLPKVPFELTRPGWRGKRLILQRLAEGAVELSGIKDVFNDDVAWRRSEDRDARPRKLGKAVRVSEVETVSDCRLACVIRPDEQREPTGELADDVGSRRRPKTSDSHSSNVH